VDFGIAAGCNGGVPFGPRYPLLSLTIAMRQLDFCKY
jgi:hypothetical protein